MAATPGRDFSLHSSNLASDRSIDLENELTYPCADAIQTADSSSDSDASVQEDDGMFNNKSLIPTGNESDVEDTENESDVEDTENESDVEETELKASVDEKAVAKDSSAKQQSQKAVAKDSSAKQQSQKAVAKDSSENQQSLKHSVESSPSGNGKAPKRSRKKLSYPPPVVADDNQYEVETLLDRRPCHIDLRTVGYEYLVKWEGYGHEFNSWVKETDIHAGLIKDYNDETINVRVPGRKSAKH